MLIYAFIFGVVFDGREPYFTAFIFVGLTAWTFFNKCVQASVRMVKNNKSIIDKVYMPKYVLAYTRMGVDAFKMLISFVIVACMMVVYRVDLTWNIPPGNSAGIPVDGYYLCCDDGLHASGGFCGRHEQHSEYTSSSPVLCHRYLLFGQYKAPGTLRGVGLKAESGCLYSDGLRKCLLYGQTPDMRIFALWLVAGILVAAIGVKIIYRYENGYAKVV